MNEVYRPSAAVVQALELKSPIINPDNDNQWWRKFPNNKTEAHGAPLGSVVGTSLIIPPAQALNVALHHFDVLADMGLPQPTISNYYDTARSAVYTLAHNVDGLDGIDIMHGGTDKAAQISARLLDYATWVENANQEYMLWDIEKDRQYIYGRTIADPTDKLYLIDTDFFLIEATFKQLNFFRNRVRSIFGPPDQSSSR